jgi:hypothetical protein
LTNLGKISAEDGMVIVSDGPVTEVFPDLQKHMAVEAEEMVEAVDEENEDFEDMEDDEEDDKKKLVTLQ